MKVEIVEWKSYCTWHWDLASSDGYVDELCGICRVSYDGTCPNCKYPGDQCPIVLGSGCTHNFHLHSIRKWLEQETSKGLCPRCRQIFTFKEQKKQTPEEVAKLKKLIDGHKVMRERPEQADQEFEEYVPETIG